MTEVLSPPAASSSPSPHTSRHHSPDPPSSSLPRRREPRSRPGERIPSYAQNRMSAYSRRTSRSRSQSAAFPAFPSSLPYALVRDFAYPLFHPMHYGSPPDPPSGSTTPGSEWNASRRSSDPMEGIGRGGWSAGPWGGDGVIFGDPEQECIDPLPSTSFGDEGEASWEDRGSSTRMRHRKSKSHASISDFERGRRRESGRRSRVGEEQFQFSGQQTDPAGRDSLRHSRSYGSEQNSGHGRRDSHFAATLPPRSFHHSQPVNLDSDMPLDSEIPTSASFQPAAGLRQSMGPEDEELFAGESLALYSFEPENANELKLTEGQHILVSYRHGQGWLVAEDKETGEQGLVPEEYVRLISEIPNYDPETRRFTDVSDVDGEGDNGADDSELLDQSEDMHGDEAHLADGTGTMNLNEQRDRLQETLEPSSGPLKMGGRAG